VLSSPDAYKSYQLAHWCFKIFVVIGAPSRTTKYPNPECFKVRFIDGYSRHFCIKTMQRLRRSVWVIDVTSLMIPWSFQCLIEIILREMPWFSLGNLHYALGKSISIYFIESPCHWFFLRNTWMPRHRPSMVIGMWKIWCPTIYRLQFYAPIFELLKSLKTWNIGKHLFITSSRICWSKP